MENRILFIDISQSVLRLNDNFRQCENFISNILFETKNIFDRMFAKDSEIHGSFLNNEIHALKELLKTKTDLTIRCWNLKCE